jgi:hypothetical protein
MPTTHTVATSPASAAGLDLRGLLTIDVVAELRKLCQAQLQGPWQLPAELVRRAIRAGASNVRVTFGRGRVVVSDDGAGLDPALVQWTAILVDRDRRAEERHLALATLEKAGEPALLALGGLDQLRELTIQTVSGGREHALSYQRGTPATMASGAARAAGGTQVVLQVPGLPRRQAARWLADVARFAPVSLVVDGKPVADGLAGALVQAPLAPPLRGQVALVARGDTAHAYLLAHGLVTAHLSIPEVPAFQAAVELGATGGELTPARLREAAVPHLAALTDQAVALLARAAEQPWAWSEPQRARLAQLTLQAVRRNLRPQQVERLGVFRILGATGPALVDLASLRRAAAADAAGARTLLALSPGQPADHYAIGPEPVLLADDAERSLLAELLEVRFRAPTPRQSAHSIAALARRLVHQAGRWLAEGLALIRHPTRRPPLPEHTLTVAERAFLMGLREQMRNEPVRGVEQILFCEGQGPLRRPRGTPPVLVLPRANPTVQACLRAFSADRRWTRLICLALVGATRAR